MMQVNYTLVNTAVPVGELEPVLDDYISTTVTAQVRPLPVITPVLATLLSTGRVGNKIVYV